ncbi:MAG: lysophospholipid acyltransferase family protein [Chloroflexota bacterium]
MPVTESFHIPLRYRLTRPILKVVFQSIFRVLARIRVTGQENVPLGTSYIVAINHISIYDPPFAAAFWPESLEIIGAADVFDKPGQGQLLRLYGVKPVHRGEYDRELLEHVIRALRAGRRLLIAPEGGRSHVTAMRRAHPGVAYIVEQTGAPVVPVGVVGTTKDFWQRAKRGERPQLELRIGGLLRLPPVEGKGPARREARQRNADLVMRHMAGLLPEEYRGVYADSAILPAETGR